MQRSTAISLVILVVVVVAAGVFVLTRHTGTTTSNTSSPSSQAASSPSSSPAASQAVTAANSSNTPKSGATVSYTSSGFSPSRSTMAAGSKFTIKNDSSSAIQFDSNPHPQHTDNTELNVGVINPGATATVTLTRKGTWGFHNHLDAGMTGSITVQ
jgi:plastocyanin